MNRAEKYLPSQGLIDREGKYYPCEFGDHEHLACILINNLDMCSEYEKWESTHKDQTQLDFLLCVKNWGTRSNAECMGVNFECNRPNELMKSRNENIEFYFKYIERESIE